MPNSTAMSGSGFLLSFGRGGQKCNRHCPPHPHPPPPPPTPLPLLKVPPYMLQELVEKLDCILVDHAQREYRRTHDPSAINTREFRAREELRRVGRIEPETVERRGVFSKREGPTSILRRFIPPRPAIHKFISQRSKTSDTDQDE